MNYNCVVHAFAKALKITPTELVAKLPHDGTLKLPGSDLQRSHHIQEIVDAASEMGCWFAPIELLPRASYPQIKRMVHVYFGEEQDIVGNFKRFKAYLKDSTGVLTGMRGNTGHAVYWNGHECFDQRGFWPLWDETNSFSPDTYWRAVWVT